MSTADSLRKRAADGFGESHSVTAACLREVADRGDAEEMAGALLRTAAVLEGASPAVAEEIEPGWVFYTLFLSFVALVLGVLLFGVYKGFNGEGWGSTSALAIAVLCASWILWLCGKRDSGATAADTF